MSPSPKAPVDLAHRIRQLAEKRAKQASQAPDRVARHRLLEVAANYRALAEAVERQPRLAPVD